MLHSERLTGLIAASFTPLHENGDVDIAGIPAVVEHLVEQKISGIYAMGSTGEGVSFSQEERCAAAEAFVRVAAGRLPVIIQVGCDSLTVARQIAHHAQQIGADAISAVCPVYFKPDSIDTLVDSMAEIASSAPDLPFYYYHIPTVTGVDVSMIDFLRIGGMRIPTLRGIKYTSTNVFDYQSCRDFSEDRFDILWGLDEMLLYGLTAGARAAVGSTYNFAAPIYQQLLSAFSDGDLDEAGRQQSRSQSLVRTFGPYGSRAAQKAIMAMIGQDCGPTRLPVAPLRPSQFNSLRNELEEIGFFEWVGQTSAAPLQS